MSKGVCINRREPSNWKALGHRPFRVGRGWPLKTDPIPKCVAKFGTFATKGVRKNRKEPHKLGSAGGSARVSGRAARGRGWPLEISSSPHVIVPNLVVLGQTIQALLRRSPRKFDPSRPAFQAHSRSLEPTQTYDFLLTSIGTKGLSRTFSEINDWFLSKIAFSHTPVYFVSAMKGFPLELDISVGVKKN